MVLSRLSIEPNSSEQNFLFSLKTMKLFKKFEKPIGTSSFCEQRDLFVHPVANKKKMSNSLAPLSVPLLLGPFLFDRKMRQQHGRIFAAKASVNVNGYSCERRVSLKTRPVRPLFIPGLPLTLLQEAVLPWLFASMTSVTAGFFCLQIFSYSELAPLLDSKIIESLARK